MKDPRARMRPIWRRYAKAAERSAEAAEAAGKPTTARRHRERAVSYRRRAGS